MSGNPDELGIAAAQDTLGGVFRLRDIPGVGDTTISNLRRIGVRDVQDVANRTVDELTRAQGVGVATAERIKEAVPEDNTRDTTRSVSAAGIRAPFGEFKVEAGDHDSAEATFDTSLNMGNLSDRHRTQEAAAADKGRRAPITTDIEEWRANKGALDFPGVDTPTDDPEVMEKDRRFLAEEDLIPDVRDTFF